MTTQNHEWDKKNTVLWGLILIVACSVYFTGLSHESVWYDEAFSMMMTEHTTMEIIRFTMADNHPPLYYLLLNFTLGVLGTSEAALRALSAFGAVLIVLMGAGPVRRIFGNRTAYIYAAVTLFTPAVLVYAHEARMYTLAMLSVTAGVLYSHLAVRHHRRRDWILFGLATLAAAYLHYYALIAAFFTHIFSLIVVFTKQPDQRKPALLTGGLVLLGYLPWVIPFVKQILDVKTGFWLLPTTVDDVVHAFYQPFVFKDYFHWPNEGIKLTMHLALFISLLMIVLGVIVAIKKKAQPFLSFGGLLLFVYIGTLVTAILVSVFLTPIFYARYFLVCSVLYSLLLSISISVIPKKILPPIMVGIFALMNVFVIKGIYTDYHNHPMKKLVAAISQHMGPDDLIATSDSYSLGPSLYYFPDVEHYHYSNVWEARWGHVLDALRPFFHEEAHQKTLFSQHRPFWYITSNSGGARSVDEIVRFEHGWNVVWGPKTISEPSGYIQFTVAKYAWNEKKIQPPKGNLSVNVTGIRPIGRLFISLYNGPIVDYRKSYRFTMVDAGEELSYTFENLDYGDYVVFVSQDEDGNMQHDMDSEGERSAEGVWFFNPGNLDLTKMKKSTFTFEQFKFSLDEPKRVVEGKMHYPPK